jgi:hypothetical protein
VNSLPKSFVATETALSFLNAGYRVKGTGRTRIKLETWISNFPEHKDNFEPVIVVDMCVLGSYDEAVKGGPLRDAIM